MNDKPWIYEHLVQSPYDKKPRIQPLRFATREEATRRRDECTRGGCCGSCRRAGAGSGAVHQ